MQATRAIIHIDNFLSNFQAVRERVGPRRLICVPLKADAYGHGSIEIARAVLKAGAFCVGVASVDEGAELRSGGISAPVMIFSQPLFDEIPHILENSLIPLVSDMDFAHALDAQAAAAGVKVPVHLKINTGMGRMGVSSADAPGIARYIAASAGLEYAGTATHLACSDSAEPADSAYTRQQLACFNDALAAIRAAGVDPGIVHAANSGAVLLHPESWFDMVRPGILLYGYQQPVDAPGFSSAPGGGTQGLSDRTPIKPVMELRSKIVFIRKVTQGESLSYGRTWHAPRDTVIGVIPAGYADGLPRLASNRWQVSVNGRLYPLVGRICMDQCMADLGPETTVKRWDEASIFGGPAPDAAALAETIGTIPYEITCNINKRVPRVYEA
jgi:alanine racemase